MNTTRSYIPQPTAVHANSISQKFPRLQSYNNYWQHKSQLPTSTRNLDQASNINNSPEYQFVVETFLKSRRNSNNKNRLSYPPHSSDSERIVSSSASPSGSYSSKSNDFCSACCLRFEELTVLPCGDSFCRNCLENATFQGSLSVNCPKCWDISILPPFLITDCNCSCSYGNSPKSCQSSPVSDNERLFLPADWSLVPTFERNIAPFSARPAMLNRDATARLQAANPNIPTSLSEPLQLDLRRSCDVCGGYADVSWKCNECNLILCGRCQESHNNESQQCQRVDFTHTGTGQAYDYTYAESPSGHTVEMQSQPSTPAMNCPYHSSQELKYYCGNCETALCRECAETFEHSAHAVILLKDAISQHRAMLRNLLDKVQTRLVEMETSIGLVDQSREASSSKSSEAMANLSDCFQHIEQLIAQRKQMLRSQLEQKALSKEQELDQKKDALQRLLIEVKHKFSITDETVETGNEAEVLLVAREIATKLVEFTEMDLKDILSEEDYVVFQKTNLQAVEELVGCLGIVIDKSSLITNATLHGDGSKFCIAGRRAYCALLTRNIKGQLIDVDPSLIQAEILTHLGHKTHQAVQVDGNRDGTFELSYLVEHEGAYLLSVKVCEHDIKESPFHIRCVTKNQTVDASPTRSSRSRSVKSGSRVRFPAASNRPSEAPSGYCSVHGRPSVIWHSPQPANRQRSPHSSKNTQSARQQSPKGFPAQSQASPKSFPMQTLPPPIAERTQPPIDDDLVVKVGTGGRGRGQFTNPQGIASTSAGEIIVADSNNQCVQIFSEDGECRLKFGLRGRGPGQMQRPTGVAVMPSNGNILVADYDNKWVNMFDQHGKYLLRFGAGKMLGPKGLAVTRTNQIVVVDNKGSTILMFSPSGKFIRKFGGRGLKPHQFAGPHYVAVNRENHLYITDFHNHCVKVFDGSGQYLFKFGSMGEGNGQFQAPTGIAIDENQNVLVADWGNSRIQIFDSNGSFLCYVNSISDPVYGPQGLAAFGDSYVAVADSGNHCYKLYKYLT